MAKVQILAVLSALGVACAPFRQGRAFDNSSADFNEGRPHELTTRGELETVADAVVTIMESSSGATLAKRWSASAGSTVLSFRISAERATRTTSKTSGVYFPPSRLTAGVGESETVTHTDYIAFGSRFYVELTQHDGSIQLSALGVPVIEGIAACPPSVAAYRKCSPHPATDSSSVSDNVKRNTGVSVTGAKEAEILNGLLAQLQRKRWQDVFRSSADTKASDRPSEEK